MSVEEKKIALVTGASKGIGRALVNELISKGWYVAGVARSKEALGVLSEKFGDRFFGSICKVGSYFAPLVLFRILE